MRHRIARLLLPLAAAALGLLAALPAFAATVPVAMLTFPLSFQPKNAVVNVGDTVTWSNPGPAPHTATSVIPGAFDSGFMTTGQTFSHVFPQGGVFDYFCAVGDHRAQGMVGTVFVLNAPIAPGVFIATARLSGAEEVPPVATRGWGLVTFRLLPGGTALAYTLSASSLDSAVTGAHIHFGQQGVNGPVVVNLLKPGACTTGPAGVRCAGTITAGDLLDVLAGKSLGHLLGAMQAGTTYVNVHSTTHPGGEIRGQL